MKAKSKEESRRKRKSVLFIALFQSVTNVEMGCNVLFDGKLRLLNGRILLNSLK